MASSPNKSETVMQSYKEPERHYGDPFTFPVVVESVIGEVVVDPFATGPSPREAAFALIARHGDEGTYSFPLEDGNTEYVTIERSRDED